MAKDSNKRKRLWQKIRICFVCGEKITKYEDASLEHVLPKSKGGKSNIRNLTLSHKICNHMRGNIICRLVWQLKIKIKFTKKRPFMDLSPKDIEKAWLNKMMRRLESTAKR